MTDAALSRTLYERAVKEHSQELFHYAVRLSGRDGGAEDLVQETFLHAWRSIHTLRDETALRAWLFQILRRRHFRTLNKRRVARTVPLEDAAELADKMCTSTDMANREVLQVGLDRLDIRFKRPFLMVYSEGLSCAAAARELNIPLGTLLSRIFRAKQSLRASIDANPLHAGQGAATRNAGNTGVGS